jgi:hypothetical protein
MLLLDIAKLLGGGVADQGSVARFEKADVT